MSQLLPLHQHPLICRWIAAAVLLSGLGTLLPSFAASDPVPWKDDLAPISQQDWTTARAAHLLNRAGFGGTPDQVAKLAAMTPEQAVNSLVDYEDIDDSALPPFEPSGIYPNGFKFIPVEEAVKDILTTGKAYGVVAARPGERPFQPVLDEFYTLLVSEHGEMNRAGQWWANRMLISPRPLQERLTFFWHGHFATSQEKVMNFELMLGQMATLRRHSSGSFRKLLIAMAQDPAMLIWLDNRENVKGRPNENFAREIMELFCLGEGRGYTEADIRELARALTGWTLPLIRTTRDAAHFVEDARLHDYAPISLLGTNGVFKGEEAIEIILSHPSTARFIARKLYREFVREELSPELNQRLADVLRQNDYELKPVLKTIFLSRDFHSDASTGSQIKGPVYFLISTFRKLGLKSLPTIPDFTETSGILGQTLFYPPNVSGWPGGRSWINPATLLARGNYVHELLFADADAYVPPDKTIAEGYRQIPNLFPQYHIQPYLWNPHTGRMEPVSLSDYHLAETKLAVGGVDSRNGAAAVKLADSPMMGGGGRSKMSEMAESEWYNLAMGVYSGFVEAYNRVKPIPRGKTMIDGVAMVRQADAHTPADAVACLCRRFLSVPLKTERSAAIIQFLETRLDSKTLEPGNSLLPNALLETLHLILSTPEYQVD